MCNRKEQFFSCFHKLRFSQCLCRIRCFLVIFAHRVLAIICFRLYIRQSVSFVSSILGIGTLFVNISVGDMFAFSSKYRISVISKFDCYTSPSCISEYASYVSRIVINSRFITTSVEAFLTAPTFLYGHKVLNESLFFIRF